MSNNKLKNLIAIFATLLIFLLAVVCFVHCFFGYKVDTAGFLKNTNLNLAQNGETRLIYDGSHLYKTNENFLFFEASKVLDKSFAFDRYNYSLNRMEREFVTDNQVLYFYDSKENRRELHIKYRASGETQKIASNVDDLIQLHEQNIYYLKLGTYDANNPNNNELWQYNFETKQNICLLKDISTFCISDNMLYTVACKTSRFSLASVHINILRKYNIETMELTAEKTLPLNFVASNIMANNCYLALWTDKQSLYLYTLDSSTGEYLFNNGGTGQARINVNFSSKNMYISMSFSELTKMDSLFGVETNVIGTWSYDLETKEWKQLSKDVYDGLFVFDETSVFGVTGKKINRLSVG